MKFAVAFLFVLLFSCSSKHEKQKLSDLGSGKLKFEEYSFNFDELKQGDVVGHRFAFFNEGDAPVTIQKVDKFCGCTDVIYPHKPVMPGDTSYVEVIFDTKGRYGRQVKRIALYANDSAKMHELLIWAEIKD